jgi:DNA-binding transcriptional MocR family regulator
MIDTIAFTRGVPPLDALPREELATCFDTAIRDDPAALQYGKMPLFTGLPLLREMIGSRYSVDADRVFVSNGSLQLLDLLAHHVLRSGDTVLVEEPCYDRAAHIFRRRGARVVGIPLEHDGVAIEVFERAARELRPRLAYLVCDFQNPAGVTTSTEKRRALVESARRHGMLLLEDVPYRDLRYAGQSPPLLRSLDAERVVTLGSFSKTIAPGIRVGFLIAEREVVQGLARVAEDTYLSPAVVSQAAVVEFFRRGMFEPNLERLRALYAPRWKAAVAAIRELPVAKTFTPEGGFFVSVCLEKHTNADNLVERAKERGLLLSSGAPFFADSFVGTPDSSRFVRIPFQALSPEELREGVRRLRDVVCA